MKKGIIPKAPKASSEHVRKTMQGNRSKDTKPEIRLRKQLRRKGIVGYRIHWKNAPGCPDIAFPGKKIAIFVHGCFWHQCPHCGPHIPSKNKEYWVAKLNRNVERDAMHQEELNKDGWKIIVIWECELSNNIEDAVARIIQAYQ